jgi:chromosome segregation ATPase
MAKANFENVAAAASELQKNGERVTVRTVTTHLGGGSPNDITTFLREWRAGRPSITDSVLEIPAVTLDGIRAAMMQASEKSATLAESKASEFEENEGALQSEIVSLQKELAASNLEKTELTEHLVQQNVDIAVIQKEVERLEITKADGVSAAEKDRDNERQRANDLLDQLIDSKAQLEASKAVGVERNTLKAELNTARQDLAKAETAAAVAQTKAESAVDSTTKADKRCDDLAAKLEKLETNLVAINSKSDEAEKRAAVADANAGAADRRADQAEKRENATAAKLDELQKKLDNIQLETKKRATTTPSANVKKGQEKS